MSDANLTALAFCREIEFGVPQVEGPWRETRFTGESIAHQKETVISNEINASRQVTDLVMVGGAAGGSLDFEFSQAEYQEFILAALGQVEWTPVNVTAVGTVSAAAQSLVTTGGGFANVPVGGQVKVSGLVNADNNGIRRVIGKSVDNNTLTFAAGSFPTTNAVNASIVITGKDARIGLLKPSFTLERRITKPELNAGTWEFQTYVGMTVDEFNLSLESKSIITGSIVFAGKTGVPAYSSAYELGGTFATATLTVGTDDPADGDLFYMGDNTVGDYPTYILKTAIGNIPNAVKIDGTAANMAKNIRDAIRADVATYGITHNVALPDNYVIVDTEVADTTVEVTARRIGAWANDNLSTYTSAAAGALAWNSGGMAGGVDPEVYDGATTGPVMNGTTNVGSIYKGNQVATERFKSMALKIKANVRPKDSLGEFGAFEMGIGRVEVTGTLSAYFRDNGLYRSLINHEYTAISFVMTDARGKSLAVTLPYVNFGAGDPFATGINTDIMISPEFTAIMHPVLRTTIIVNAFD